MVRVVCLSLIAMALVLGCAEDIVVKPPSSLVGVYEGKMTVVRNASSSNPGPTMDQWIEWTFSDYRFWMKAEKTDLLPQVFCDVTGNYATTDKITLSDVTPSGLFTCDHGDFPSGTYALQSKPGDSLQISGLKIISDADQRYITILLHKKPQ